MIEVLRRHQNLSKAEARKVAIDMLGKVGNPVGRKPDGSVSP